MILGQGLWKNEDNISVQTFGKGLTILLVESDGWGFIPFDFTILNQREATWEQWLKP